MKTIFLRPLFINPQAYLIIPDLASIHNSKMIDFNEDSTYSVSLLTSGRVESTIKKAKDDYILSLDLYSIDGNCKLGEWIITDSVKDINIDNLSINTKGNKLIITYNNN